MIHHGDCLEIMPTLPAESVDSIVTDPPYAEIDRPYGRMTESQWHEMMDEVVRQSRRILKPTGSAVFILQPNSEKIGRMRPWLFEFMAKWAKEWNMIQDAWWWNISSPPTVHCHRTRGLMRPSLKACVWLGSPDCYRNQDEVLWSESFANAASRNGDRALRKSPSGLTIRRDRCASAAKDRNGVTHFNVLPIANANSSNSSGSHGHGAGTPQPIAEWWIKYLTPVDGITLDPFAGAGTMPVAAIKTGRQFIGIEREAEYVEIAKARIAHARGNMPLLESFA